MLWAFLTRMVTPYPSMQLLTAGPAYKIEVVVTFGGVGVAVSDKVNTPRQINLVHSSHFLGVELHAGGNKAHGVTTAALLAGVWRAAVNQFPVVQAGLIFFQHTRHRHSVKPLDAANFGGKDIFRRIHRNIVGKAIVVGSGNHPHTAIFWRGSVHCQPQSHHFHWIEKALPVRRVFMPGNPLAVSLRFADKATRPQRNVGANDGFNQVEHFVGEQPFKQGRVSKVWHVQMFGAKAGVERGQSVLEVILQSLEFLGCEHVLVENDEPFATVGLELLGRKAGNR